ncbi:MAG: phosphate ABC transporter substrate-binding protein PstS, partial [Stenotrophomonas acidaminiphila]
MPCGGKTDAPATTAGADAAPTAAAGAQQISAELTGAGASFIYPLMARWSTDYNKATGAKINYQSIGSGGGIAAQAGLAQFPSVIGGVVPVINVEGLQPGQLKLSGTVLADIFLHKITTWNDPAIVALNPGVTLPTGKINTVHRSDGSGTTFNFVNYLAKVSPEWKSKVGEGTSVNWPGGVGGKGNEGVAAYVRQLKGSIGYVELAYAEQNNMSYASLQNAAGQFVKPTPESFAAAAASADWANAKDFNLVITNAPGEQAWPITATNFILVYKQPKDATKAKHTLAFF